MEHVGSDDEIFLPLKGFEKDYIISSKGYVVSFKSGNPIILQPYIDGGGYYRVSVGIRAKIKVQEKYTF